MKSLNQVYVFALSVVLLTVTGLIAEERQKKARFGPAAFRKGRGR